MDVSIPPPPHATTQTDDEDAQPAPNINEDSSSTSFIITRALGRSFVEHICTPKEVEIDVKDVVQRLTPILLRRLGEEFNGKFKVQFSCKVQFKNPDGVTKEWYISNRATPYQPTFLSDGAQELQKKIEAYSSESSGWSVNKIEQLSFRCTKYLDFSRLNGHSYIPTPAELRSKKAIINVKNKHDNKCFLYAILALLKRNDVNAHCDRVANYEKYLSLLKFKEEDMPMRLSNIAKFERANPTLSINVIKYTRPANSSIDEETNDDDDDDVVSNEAFDIVYKTGNKSAEHKINLLLLEEPGKFHYVGVTKLNRLLNTHNGTRTQNTWCHGCLRGFRVYNTYLKHIPLCETMSKQLTVYTFPEEPILKFRDWGKTIPPKFIIYADFESTLEPTGAEVNLVEKHMPIAAGFVMIDSTSPNIKPVYQQFFGSDCVVEFLRALEVLARDVKLWYDEHSKTEMKVTVQSEEDFKSATTCYLCKLAEARVRDHDHFTGEYLGAACNECNLSRRLPKKPFLPVVFHNLRGYDMHHILKHAVSKFTHWSLNCIPQSSQQFLSLTAYIDKHASLRFIDSLRFLNASLDNLAKTLSSKPLTQALTDIPDIAKSTKSVFPYCLASSQAALEESRAELPDRSLFKDRLSGGEVKVSADEHAKAVEIWRECDCKSLYDYMMIYLKVDVYLLADVFESFRKTGIAEDGLDPANFFTIPGLSWSSALKNMSSHGYELDMLHDSIMYEYFESGVRGGMTFVNKHYVPNDADHDSLLYIDVNNLYGWALSQPLPTSNFEWVDTPPSLDDLPSDDSDVGYIFEVDMEIPAHLHDYLSDLPPAPLMEAPPGSRVKKLLLTLRPKTHYVIHYMLLKFYLELGVVVTKIHRTIRFSQAPIFKDYIDYNTKKRAATSCKFSKDYYKLKNNSLFGKTVENLRKRVNLRLCNSEEKLIAYSSKPTFVQSQLIDGDLVAAFLQKENICLDRPVYVGQAVLDISKLRMYRLQYVELEHYRRRFDCSIEIVAGDTDSFFLKCSRVSVNNQLLPAMKADGHLDTSNYPPDHPLYSNDVANKIGLFKDESGGVQTYLEWIFLRSKSYSMLTKEGKETKKAKGVIRSVVSNSLAHSDYKRIYESLSGKDDDDDDDDDDGPTQSKVMRVMQSRIGSINHQLHTITTSKVALSAQEDKRAWTSQNESLPYGHYKLL